MDPQEAETRTDPPDSSHWKGRAAAIAGTAIVIAFVVVAAMMAMEESTTTPIQGEASISPPARGTACAALRSAYQAYVDDADDALRDDLKAAGRAAVAALETSGQVFGAPERIALTLSDEVLRGPARVDRIDALFASARQECAQLDQWSD